MPEKQKASSVQVSSLRRNWTQGPILRNLLLLSWPMMVMEATYMVSQLFDMVWVGRSGSAAIAGLGIGLMITFMISAVDMAIISGGRAMISRFTGAGDTEGAHRAAGQVLVLAFSWGLLVTLGGYFLARPLIGMFGVEPEVVAQGSRFLRVIFMGWVSLEMLVMCLYIMQASGDSLNPMIVEISIRTVHVALCPFLVLGLWIFPQMGIAGAALSNVISQILGALLGLWFIFGGHTRIKLTLEDLRFIPASTWRLLKIGIPGFISMAQMTASNFVLTWIIAPFGTASLAAHSVVGNISGFVGTPGIGMGNSVGVLVGQNLGAKQPERATRSAWLGVGILQIFLVLVSIVILIWANGMVALFTQDAQMISIAAAFLRIATAGYLVMGVSSVLLACFNGAGDTLPAMLVNIGMIWAVQIPLAYLLSHYGGLHVYGVRWALVGAGVSSALAAYLYFRFGRWKTKKI